MKRRLDAFGMVLGLAASCCAAPKPQAATGPTGIDPNALVLQWFVAGNEFGRETIDIDREGRARYVFTPAAGQSGAPIDVQGALSYTELDELRGTLARNRFCQIRSRRSRGHAHETQPTLTVSFTDLQCEKSFWAGEWQDIPAARACQDAIDAVRTRLRNAAHPASTAAAQPQDSQRDQ